ncbi:MAG: hypothetical protein AAGG01_04685 [Planctomycetota bacterium]
MTRKPYSTAFLVLAGLLTACAAPPPEESQVAVDQGRAEAGPPRFSAPAGWVEEAPANSMRLVQFRTPGDAGSLCIVNAWPNGVGPLEANLDRWVGQVGLKSAASLEDPQRSTRTIRGHTVTTIHVEGPLAAGMSGGEALEHGAVLAAFIESPTGPSVWTVKLQGDAAEIAAQRGGFDEMLSGL